MLYFNCDYTEGAHPHILEKMQETNLEQTIGYGEDEYCEQARTSPNPDPPGVRPV